MALYPIPDTSNNVIGGLVRDYPVQLSSGTDAVDLGDFEARLCVVVAAVILNTLNGRTDLNESIVTLLPQFLRDKLATHEVRAEINS